MKYPECRGTCRRWVIVPPMIRLAGRAVPALACLLLTVSAADAAPKKKKKADAAAAKPAEAAAPSAPDAAAPADPAAPPPEEMTPAPDPEADAKVDNDNPNKPDALTIAEPPPDVTIVEPERKVMFSKTEYPIAVTDRPLTLPRNMGEIALDAPFFIFNGGDAKAFTQILHAGFGVTNRYELGLTYAVGLELIDPQSKFEAGKAFSIDGKWTAIPDWLAVQASLGFQVSDPFAMSLGLGAPFRLRVGEKVRIVGLYDMLRVKLVKYPVDPLRPAENIAASQGLAVSVDPAEANLALNFAAQYQHKPNLMFYFSFDNYFPDLKVDDHPVSTFLGLVWSKSARFDLGARVGALRLDEAADSLSVAVSLAFRL